MICRGRMVSSGSRTCARTGGFPSLRALAPSPAKSAGNGAATSNAAPGTAQSSGRIAHDLHFAGACWSVFGRHAPDSIGASLFPCGFGGSLPALPTPAFRPQTPRVGRCWNFPFGNGKNTSKKPRFSPISPLHFSSSPAPSTNSKIDENPVKSGFFRFNSLLHCATV